MAKYIEREAALQKIKKLQATDPKTVGKKQFADGYFLGLDEAEIIIKQAPAAADLVEVVRCEHCKFRALVPRTKVDYKCTIHSTTLVTISASPDGFCHLGKRKDEEPVKHGQWVENDNGGWVCSECDCWIDDYYGDRPEDYPYCPKCYAKMEVLP